MKAADVQIHGCYIDGQWTVLDRAKVIEIKNPADGSTLALVPRGGKEEINLAVKSARKAFRSEEWKTLQPYNRGKLLFKIADMIRLNKADLAKLETLNAAVLKPAEDTPLTTLKLVELMESLDYPKGLVNVVTGYGHEAGAALSAHPDINHVTFTGSVETGKRVIQSAAENIVPVTLELGGKSPNIVFADCNEEKALEWVLRSIVQNAGQTCSAGSRLVIEKSIKERFVGKLANAMEKLTIDKPD